MVLRKTIINDEFKKRTFLDASNDHAVTTLLSFLLMIPVVQVYEVSYLFSVRTFFMIVLITLFPFSGLGQDSGSYRSSARL